MLEVFLHWAEEMKRAAPATWTVEVSAPAGISNPSARVDIDAGDVLARITFWQSGQYHAECVSIDSEETLISLHGEHHDGLNIVDALSSFIRRLEGLRGITAT